MDSGGEWRTEVWADSCSERNIRLQFRGKGARPWVLERRNGFARGIYNRLRGKGRFVDRAIIEEAQYCLSTTLNHGGFSAYRMVSEPDPVNLYSQ